MKKALGAVFGLIGAILLLLPVAATAGPVLPGEPIGSQIFCNGTQSASSGRFITMGGALGRAQPIRPHGTCSETLSITDTRVNITILGDGGDTIRNSSACADPLNTLLLGEDPSQAQIIQVRGRNITITGIEIRGQNITANPPFTTKFLQNNLNLFDGIDFDSSQCPSSSDANRSNPGCNNNRGIRAQRGGIMLIGRHSTVGAFQPKLTDDRDNHNPRQYEEKSGVCIHDVSKNGIEVTQSSTARIINTEIKNVTGDAVNVSETSTVTVGFSSGTELNLTTDPFPGQGNGGPNYLHNNTGNGVAVQRNSYARIVGNSIVSNAGAGVSVTRGAGADVADNVLNGNARGVDVNDNSQVNMGTTNDSTNCSLTTPAANTIPVELGGGLGSPAPTAAGQQCPGGGKNSGVQNTGTTGSGIVNLGNVVNSVTVNNTSTGIRCQRSYITGRSTSNRDGSVGGLNANGGSFTSCVSSLN
jgi:hypothetical protein